MGAQVKSRQRVVEHGEVFTSEREVNAMLDLVKQETERIESRFLEPACGDGNFLAEILRRKLEVVNKRYGKKLADWEKYTFVAVGSIYGVELLQDNAKECRKRLLGIVEASYIKASKKNIDPRFMAAIEYVLGRNILCGDALSLKDENDDPIIFSEWSMATGSKVKRRDFRLDEMLEGHKEQRSLFDLSGGSATEWEYDEEVQAFIPLPIKEYPLTDFREVNTYE